jgi:hypothetical protein
MRMLQSRYHLKSSSRPIFVVVERRHSLQPVDQGEELSENLDSKHTGGVTGPCIPSKALLDGARGCRCESQLSRSHRCFSEEIV